MLGDSIVVRNMAYCPHLCEVFQQNLNTSKQMFQKKPPTFLKYNMHRSDCIFVTKVKQIDMLNKKDNVLNLTKEVIKSISLNCWPLFLVFAHKPFRESTYPLFSTGKIKHNFASGGMKRVSTCGNVKVTTGNWPQCLKTVSVAQKITAVVSQYGKWFEDTPKCILSFTVELIFCSLDSRLPFKTCW